jgi:tight adherence protein B
VSPVIGALLGLGVGAALLLMVYSLRRRPVATVRPRRMSLARRWSRLTRRPAGRQGRRRDLKLAAVAVLAVAAFVVTRWPVALLVVPTIVLLVPWLLQNKNAAGIERTAAVETWVRGLRSLLQGGSENTLEGALQASLSAAPEPIKPEITALVTRMRARWSTERALARFAEDLDDPTADTVAAALMLAARRRGFGLSEVLSGLSDSVSDEVRARRKIESDRATPRTAAVALTYGTLALGIAMALFSPETLAPYGTPIGQVVLIVIIGGYLATLFMLRRITTAKERPRLHPVAAPSAAGGFRAR